MINWALIPLITQEEETLINEINNSGKIILLFVIDEKLKQEPASVVSEKIKQAEAYLEKIKSMLETANPDSEIKDYLEWGNWDEKIISIAKIEAIKNILIKKSDEAELIIPKLKASGLECISMD